MNSLKQYDVIIIGGGPAGIGAALQLYTKGIASILVLERFESIGGIPSFYRKKKRGVKTFVRWSLGGLPVYGESFVAWMQNKISQTSIEVKLESQVIDIQSKSKEVTYVSPKEGKVTISAKAIILASGGREKSIPERKWVAGSRPSKVMFSKQILALSELNNINPIKKPVIIGSDVIAYATASKLRVNGAQNSTIIDNCSTAKTPFHERLYFRLWHKPIFKGFKSDTIKIKGNKTATGVEINNKLIKADGVILSGELIPNSELVLLGNFNVKIPSRIPETNNSNQLSESGWFAAGNVLGGFHGAEWCFFNGKKAANFVVQYISKL